MWDWSFQDRTLTIVDDQVGCPTFAGDVIKAARHMIVSHFDNPQPSFYGTFHLCGQGETTWYEFARFILEEISKERRTSMIINPSSSRDYQASTSGVANRPPYAALNCHKIKETFGVSSKDWKISVREVIKQLSQNGPDKP